MSTEVLLPDRTPPARGVPPDPALPEPCGARLSEVEQAIEGRRTSSPRRLGLPAPSDAQLDRMLRAAAAAPDHGQLLPWRFLRIGAQRREALGGAFAQALRERDPLATSDQCAQARAKAHNAPLLLAAIARLNPGEGAGVVHGWEKLVSLGCAIQNLLLAAHSLGFQSALTSGRAIDAAPVRALLRLARHERAVCFINLGTETAPRKARMRPAPSSFVSDL